MRFRIVTVLAATAGLLLLGACTDDEEPPTLDPASVRDLTGLSAPAETPAAQTARAPAIISRSDSLIISTTHGETDHFDLPTFRLRARCSGTRCTMSEPTTGFTQTIRLTDLEFGAAETVAVGTRHGITLVSGTRERSDGYLTAFGAWMDHGSFVVQTERLRERDVILHGRYGLAGGDLAGTRPTADATWRGLMVGTPATGSSRGDRLLGDATLDYDLNVDSLDIAFRRITNVDRGAAHSTRTVMFQNVRTGSGGTFEAGLTGNRIQGGFYGPGHVEAAGIFEQSNIVGAFGARRQ
ncbi:MAG: hypothetical protein OXO52_21915 [Rhodospirillales bacterium]|nr:hypothetical protein [Rhodospirillales bacterium]MDE0377971.1 hypothetical protein [Rhodospirillales bacterium]